MDTPLTLALSSQRPATGDAHLKFRLGHQTPAVFSMQCVQEALILPARRLTPMPNVPAPLLGLINRRSRVLWVLDLAQILGLALLDLNAQQYTLVLIQVGAVSLGLAVQQVEGIVRLAPEAIQPPVGQISSSLVPYLRGCALQHQEEKQEIVLVLDAEAIVQSPLLRNLQFSTGS
ncbi:MAG: purine-binding chemotaxis protein CheW [Synechococcales cyanobacterium C42_A2020_086]|jgi:twitching motility protein PilI|nr:purine-binding chemotaxis protein CheW [Synechococcales cyanobacterium M58_A2018_015]MBF2076185.1 purine-binding chemotaxis protein CheW [Synechococcales cyanobacterium C42_A2020_086]